LKVTWFAMPANGQVIRTNVNKVNAIPLLTIIAPFTRNTLIVACYIYSARSHPDREANCWPTIQYGIAFGLSIHISIARRFAQANFSMIRYINLHLQIGVLDSMRKYTTS